MKKIESNDIESLIQPYRESITIEERRALPQYNIGVFDFREDDPKSKKVIENLKWLWDNILPPFKHIDFKDIQKKIDEGKCVTFGGLRNNGLMYLNLVHKGYTAKIREETGEKYGFGAMDFCTLNDEYDDITNHTPHKGEISEDQLNAVYYHTAKAHWLIHNIREEGLWSPIQGVVNTISEDKFSLSIHPGSVRSRVFEAVGDEGMSAFIWDVGNRFEDIEPLSFDEFFNWCKENLNKEKVRGDVSAIYVNGIIEFQFSTNAISDFRHLVFDFNKKVTKLTSGKRPNIYIGYDSTHEPMSEVSRKSIELNYEKTLGGGNMKASFENNPLEIKDLDIAKIPEYNRDYANQNTEFTYSRFLIPYLENYEGFSYFIDDDYVFDWSPEEFFYFLNPDDAVAVFNFNFEKHEETKFNGQKNVSYPKKLWSSFMIFNNSHPDCKKLTPEAINTWTGKQLHQFEWTDKISYIPQKYILTEGLDPVDKKGYSAIHYTRGGPWIKDMDSSTINNLQLYRKYENCLD